MKVFTQRFIHTVCVALLPLMLFIAQVEQATAANADTFRVNVVDASVATFTADGKFAEVPFGFRAYMQVVRPSVTGEPGSIQIIDPVLTVAGEAQRLPHRTTDLVALDAATGIPKTSASYPELEEYGIYLQDLLAAIYLPLERLGATLDPSASW